MLKTIQFQDHNKLYITDEPETLKRLLENNCLCIPEYTKENESLSFPHTDYAVTNLRELLEINYDKDMLIEGIDFIPESLSNIYKRLAGLPWHILDTPRLSLREMTVDDVDEFYKIYEDDDIKKYVEPLFPDPLDEKIYTQNYIKDIYGYYGYGLWTVLDRSDNKVIGRAGISNRDGYDIPEIGFLLSKDYRGMGLGHEVCSAILDYAKKELDFSNVQALVLPNNNVSINLLSKLGFYSTDEYCGEYLIFQKVL